MQNITLPTIASLWIGDRLSEIERASIHSFLKQGHHVVVYCYGHLEGIVEGAEVRDAREIWDTTKILRYRKNGSPALHANLFRYQLMAKTDYIWSDLDIIALRPFDFATDFVFGLESNDRVNNAVLRLPKNSNTLKKLLELGHNTVGIPPGLHGHRWLKYAVRNILHRGLSIDRWPWGATGPTFLTSALKATGELRHAQSREVFYQLSVDDIPDMCDPDQAEKLEHELSNDVVGIHLWANLLNRYKSNELGGKFPEGSFVRKLIDAQFP